MHSYTAYGLCIHSFLPLPELVAGNGNADVFFKPGRVEETNLQPLDESRSFKATADEACYFFEGVGKFLVRGGREVVVDLNSGVDERAVRLCLLGPIVALLLHQQGRLVLHASAVALGDNAIAFLGGQGWGKSTLAAAFHVRGHRVLADDVTAIQTDSAVPIALPGFPQIKLWPNSIVALGTVPETLPAVHPDVNKRAFSVAGGFAQMPLPLKGIYVLAAGSAVQIESLSPREAMLELIGHSYARRFGKELLQGNGMATHFKQCARVAQNTCIYRLVRPASLSIIDEHVDMLIDSMPRLE
jgi:hypothetical protein